MIRFSQGQQKARPDEQKNSRALGLLERMQIAFL